MTLATVQDLVEVVQSILQKVKPADKGGSDLKLLLLDQLKGQSWKNEAPKILDIDINKIQECTDLKEAWSLERDNLKKLFYRYETRRIIPTKYVSQIKKLPCKILLPMLWISLLSFIESKGNPQLNTCLKLFEDVLPLMDEIEGAQLECFASSADFLRESVLELEERMAHG